MSYCSVNKCDRGVFASGLCRTHHRWWKTGKPIDGEPRIHKYDGPCIIEGCDRPSRCKKMCTKHYGRWKSWKDMDKVASYEEPIESTDAGGYIIANACHPQNTTGKAMLKHRMIMMNHLGRELLPNETVHHKNGDRADNRLSNLELWSSWQPAGQRVEDKIAWAKDLLEMYEPEALA